MREGTVEKPAKDQQERDQPQEQQDESRQEQEQRPKDLDPKDGAKDVTGGGRQIFSDARLKKNVKPLLKDEHAKQETGPSPGSRVVGRFGIAHNRGRE